MHFHRFDQQQLPSATHTLTRRNVNRHHGALHGRTQSEFLLHDGNRTGRGPSWFSPFRLAHRRHVFMVVPTRSGCEAYGMSVSESVELMVAGRNVTITNPDKVFFLARNETKLDLVNFYVAIGEPLMRQMFDRPVLLQRFPNGAHGSNFFQKRIPDGAPKWLSTTVVSTPNGTTSNALVIADLAHFVWAVNMGCLGFHSWPMRAAQPQFCDELRIDLDPGPGTTFAMAREAAHHTKALLDERGVRSYVKTTGNRGLHVYVRLAAQWDSVQVRAAAVAVARELERRQPALITASWWKEERGPRIFIDFNQNAPHKTVFAPWSVRAHDYAPVSCPFEWRELDAISPPELTIDVVPSRVSQYGDPWADINEHPQSLEPLLDMVRVDQQAGIPDAPWPPVYPKMDGEPPRVAPSRAKKTKQR
jgi:DNA ligase D